MAFYKRHLPHWQPEGAEFFITFRLAGSLPMKAVNILKSYQTKLQEENKPGLKGKIRRMIFQKYETILDGGVSGPIWLKEEKVAQVVQEALYYHDKKSYDLYAFTIMPNHVHLVFQHLNNSESVDIKDGHHVTNILHSIKSYTALECNKLLKRKGAFWQSESFDRVIRDQDELENTMRYTLDNPVKAGFVQKWEDWPFSYCKPLFVEIFKTA